jgi:hypothetical protein
MKRLSVIALTVSLLAANFGAQAGTFNLTITYPDAQQTRILNAMKTYWTTTSPTTGQPVVPTTAEVIEKLRLSVVSAVKDTVLRTERDAAAKAATDPIVPVDVQ